MNKTLILSTVLKLMIIISASGQSTESIFKNPPSSAKPHVWWHWMNGNITHEGITADLEAMQKAGIGGATVLDIGMYTGQGIKTPIGSVKTLSSEWFALLKHATIEANRLGLEIGFHNCGGWQSSGGPWITEDMAMKKVIWNKTLIEGPIAYNKELEQPIAQTTQSVHAGEKGYSTKDAYYRDYKIIAYPYHKSICSYKRANPEILLNNSSVGTTTIDGNPESWITFHEKGKTDTTILLMKFKEAFTASSISVLPKASSQWPHVKDEMRCKLSTSNNGIDYQLNSEFTISNWIGLTNQNISKISAKYYKLEMIIDDFMRPFDMAEISLLKVGEHPLFRDDIKFLNVKLGGTFPKNISNYTTYDLEKQIAGIVDPSEVIDITEYISADGILRWKVPQGTWAIMRIGYTITGAKNHPATPESHGLECDKMDAQALDLHFENMPKRIVDTAGELVGLSLTYTLIDSWECQHQNWTAKFPEQFYAKRGYQIWPYLPILSGDMVSSAIHTERFLHDYRLTISDLIAENYYKHFQKLSENEGLKTHAESIYPNCYACPPIDVMNSNKHADAPMIEFWANNFGSEQDFIEMKYKVEPKPNPHIFASTMHLYDKKILASEAFTTMYAHWKETPENMKSLADYQLSNGVNRMVYHSFAHQPAEQKPGYTLGMHGVCYNRHNTLFERSNGFNQYLTRVQWLAQTGRYAADILLFLGDDLPTNNTDISRNFPGYRYDYCNADALANQFKVTDGKLTLKNGAQYKILMLPKRKAMKTSTIQLLQNLANQGVLIVGPKPEFNISLEGGEKSDEQFDEIVTNLWSNTRQDKKIYSTQDYAKVLLDENILPDFKSKTVPGANILFNHHTLDSMDFYFVVNQHNHKLISECSFRQHLGYPEVWDPETGETSPLRYFYHENNYTHVLLPMQPNQSVFVVFNNKPASDYYKGLIYNNQSILPLDTTISSSNLPDFYDTYVSRLPAGEYVITNQHGIQTKVDKRQPEKISIAKPWKIELKTPFNEHHKLEMTDLISFSDFDDTDLKYFSGTATYRNSISLDNVDSSTSYLLKLGQVAEIADVMINNKKVETLWKKPYHADISSYLHSGLNELEIKVTTTWTNRVIGDLRLPAEERKTWTTADIEKWFNSESKLIKSGLLGPVEVWIVQ